MRPIKFKGVDEQGKLHELHAINWETMAGLCEVEGWAGWQWCQFEKFVQFTGLLDKNGKEIYEGDIVTAEHYGKEVKHIYEVAWSEGCCSFNFYCQTDENCGNNGAPVSDFAMGCGEGDIDAETIKVIGNIYENPELLNL